MQPLHDNVWTVLGGLLVALIAGTAVRLGVWLGRRDETSWRHVLSMLVWWVLAAGVTAALLWGRAGAVVLFGAVSLLALREFVALTSAGRDYRGGQFIAFAALPLQYLFIYFGMLAAAWMMLPVGLLMVLAARMATSGKMPGYLSAAGSLYWGTMLSVVCLSFASMLLALGEASNPVAGTAGWFLYLMLLVPINDIAQALWGRACGRKKITPVVSPHKTWEGFLLGMATTLVLAVLLGYFLTPLTAPLPLEIAGRRVAIPYLPAVVAGLIIALAGFAGDINMSALKRDLGVKDSGNLLPTQGGVLDRVDSLTFAAPAFFCYVYLLYGY